MEDAKEELLYLCTVLIESYGTLTVRCTDKDSIEIFGIQIENDRWRPLSKEKMPDAHTLAPDGTRLALEDGVTYTEKNY